MDSPLNMKTEYSSIDHALNNERIFEHLLQLNDFNDWVITTAFYASIHFLRHKIFPLSIGDNTYDTINEFCRAKRIRRFNHKVMRELVEAHTSSEISAVYNYMLDMSYTARYSKYRFSSEAAQTAKRRLTKIKAYCT
jgi:hypothetical protein